MSAWPIHIQDASGAVKVAGHAKGTPPNSGVVQVPIAFDTPGLATGVPLGKKSPVAPTVILAAWFDVIPSFDGTTPKGDIFTPDLISDTGVGLIALATGAPADMRNGYFQPGGFRYGTTGFFWPTPGTFSPVTMWHNTQLAQPDQPWFVVVSSDGTPTGGDPGATHGKALLNLLLASPA